eukprot:12898849-Prorocentrum_lima.AAC.1
MRKVTKTKNTKNQNGMVMKIPTMLQDRNGIQGKKNVNGAKKTQKATMRKMQHMGKKTKKLLKRMLNMWMVQ